MKELDPEYKERVDTLLAIDGEILAKAVQCSFLAGMQLAIRICRNRAGDCKVTGQAAGEMEAQNCAGLIRICQVEIGSGRMGRPKFTEEELDEMDRIS